jgi:hypothetical protein
MTTEQSALTCDLIAEAASTLSISMGQAGHQLGVLLETPVTRELLIVFAGFLIAKSRDFAQLGDTLRASAQLIRAIDTVVDMPTTRIH